MQTLTTYIIYSDDDDEGTKYQLPTSILEQLGMSTPKGAVFTGAFGPAGDAKIVPYLRKNLKPGQKICPVDVVVPFTVRATDYYGLEDCDVVIDDVDTLNALRMKSDLLQKVQLAWIQAARRKGWEQDESGFPHKGTHHPELVDVIRHKRLYPHVDFIVYRARTPVGAIAFASSYVKPVSATPWVDLPGEIILP